MPCWCSPATCTTSFIPMSPRSGAVIERHQLKNRVIMTGFVPDEDLVFLYSRAYALILPSLMEGFGLPAVEAMACGTPVVSSHAGSLPEVVGDAGVYFDPTDVGSMADAIRSFLATRTNVPRWPRRARERASLFTWEARRGHSLRVSTNWSTRTSQTKHHPQGVNRIDCQDRRLPEWPARDKHQGGAFGSRSSTCGPASRCGLGVLKCPHTHRRDQRRRLVTLLCRICTASASASTSGSSRQGALTMTASSSSTDTW